MSKGENWEERKERYRKADWRTRQELRNKVFTVEHRGVYIDLRYSEKAVTLLAEKKFTEEYASELGPVGTCGADVHFRLYLASINQLDEPECWCRTDNYPRQKLQEKLLDFVVPNHLIMTYVEWGGPYHVPAPQSTPQTLRYRNLLVTVQDSIDTPNDNRVFTGSEQQDLAFAPPLDNYAYPCARSAYPKNCHPTDRAIINRNLKDLRLPPGKFVVRVEIQRQGNRPNAPLLDFFREKKQLG